MSVSLYLAGATSPPGAPRTWRTLSLIGRLHQQRVFDELYAELFTVGVDQGLAVRAGEYAEELELRGYDATHLATALELGDEEVILITWGRDLTRAAELVGLGIAGIEATD